MCHSAAADPSCPSQLDPAVVVNELPGSHFFFCRALVMHDSALIYILLQLFTLLFRLLSETKIYKGMTLEDYLRKGLLKL